MSNPEECNADAPCDREECKKQLAEWRADDDEGAGYDDGGYDAQHCEWPGCHQIFWRGKNGWDCFKCAKKLCESCSDDDDKSVWVDADLGMLACTICFREIQAEEKKRRHRNRSSKHIKIKTK